MDMITQHEVYRELGAAALGRDAEEDTGRSGRQEEKAFA